MGYMIIDISGGEVVEKSDKPADQSKPVDEHEISEDTGVQIIPLVPDGHLIQQEIQRRAVIIRQINNN